MIDWVINRGRTWVWPLVVFEQAVVFCWKGGDGCWFVSSLLHVSFYQLFQVMIFFFVLFLRFDLSLRFFVFDAIQNIVLYWSRIFHEINRYSEKMKLKQKKIETHDSWSIKLLFKRQTINERKQKRKERTRKEHERELRRKNNSQSWTRTEIFDGTRPDKNSVPIGYSLVSQKR